MAKRSVNIPIGWNAAWECEDEDTRISVHKRLADFVRAWRRVTESVADVKDSMRPLYGLNAEHVARGIYNLTRRMEVVEARVNDAPLRTSAFTSAFRD